LSLECFWWAFLFLSLFLPRALHVVKIMTIVFWKISHCDIRPPTYNQIRNTLLNVSQIPKSCNDVF
jgi:hypothetical protein